MSLEHSPARGTRRIMRRKEILELLGVSNTTLWDWIRAGKFPAPISLGPNSRAWLADEIDDLIDRRREERDQSLKSTG
jgi:prophage regulatory protein